MTISEQIITIAVVIVATLSTRFLPFILFPSKNSTPLYISYLGKVLPAAVFGFLVVYCLRNVNIFAYSHGLPEILGVLITAFLHKWKRQMLFSIAGGTISYMAMLQIIFS